MRLHTRALLAVLLIVLPSSIDTASLPDGDLRRFIKLGDVNRYWARQESGSRPALASSSQQHLDAHQASQLLREQSGQNTARGHRRTQQDVNTGKQEPAYLELVSDKNGRRLFSGKERWVRGARFRIASPAQRDWILERFCQQSQTDCSNHEWVTLPSNVDHFSYETFLTVNYILGKGETFSYRPPFQPYVVGDHLILFIKERSGLFYVYGVPFDRASNDLDSANHLVTFIGTLQTPNQPVKDY